MLTGKWNGIRKIDSTGGEMKWREGRWKARGRGEKKEAGVDGKSKVPAVKL